MCTRLEASLPTFVEWVHPHSLHVPAVESEDASGDIGEDDCQHSGKILAMFIEPTTSTLLTSGVDRCVKAWRLNSFSRAVGGLNLLWHQKNLFTDRVLAIHANAAVAAVASQAKTCFFYFPLTISSPSLNCAHPSFDNFMRFL